MKETLSFAQEIDCFIRKKLSICNFNPCICPNKKKNENFQTLKGILHRLNKEWLTLNVSENQFNKLINSTDFNN